MGGGDESGSATLPTGPGIDISNSAPEVTFQILFPGQSDETMTLDTSLRASTGLIGGVKAASEAGTAARITARITLLQPTNQAQPVTTLSQTVPVDNSGSATLVFRNVPALSCVGELLVEHGTIVTHNKFHGMADLEAGATATIVIVPVNDDSLEDISARIALRLIEQPGVFAMAPATGLTRWIRQIISRFTLGTDGLFDTAFAALEESFRHGYPVQTGQIGIELQLPEGASLATSSLKVVTPLDEKTFDLDGKTNIATDLAQGTGIGVLYACENPEGNSVLLNFSASTTGRLPLSIESTAEALILIDPCIGRLSTEQISQWRVLARQHQDFPQLLSQIAESVRTDPISPLDPERHPEIYNLVVPISLDCLQQILPPASIRPATAGNTPIVSLSDTETTEIAYDNQSFCFYHAYVDGFVMDLALKDFLVKRQSTIGQILDWGAGVLALDQTTSIFGSSGKINADISRSQHVIFKKHVALSLSDGVLGAIIPILGLGEKPPVSKELLEYGRALEIAYEGLRAGSASPNSRDVAWQLLDVAANPQTIRLLGRIMARHIRKSSIRTALSVIGKKIAWPVAAAEAAYGTTELARICDAVMFDPKSIEYGPFYYRTAAHSLGELKYAFGELKNIVVLPPERPLKPKTSFDLDTLKIEVTYATATIKIISADEKTTILQTLSKEQTRTHTKLEPVFKNGGITVKWQNTFVKEAIFNAPEVSGAYPVECLFTEKWGERLLTASTTFDLEVSAIQNLAYNKTATQSAVPWTHNFTMGALNGVDGVKTGKDLTEYEWFPNHNPLGFFYALAADAEHPLPWWQVDIGAEAEIHEIKIYNRQSPYPEDMGATANMQVLMSTDGTNWESVYAHNGASWQTMSIPTNKKRGRFVKVQVPGQNFFILWEVEVMGIED